MYFQITANLFVHSSKTFAWKTPSLIRRIFVSSSGKFQYRLELHIVVSVHPDMPMF